ncbi:BTAD domain-containing putative transcriptional regulator, partial [Glycomyces sp. NPDC047010]|uniref:AfsR/SARP family transcriptional regulator n=1 Tax=Glycomyces sp. NPDC047010 TaxID=3155023 RepID=UPI0033E2D9AE
MQIRMLGPFEVRLGDGRAADVQGARLRALAAALALQPGTVVRKDALVDWIWGEHPPAEAANALHRLVSRLRKVLPEGAVQGRADGYLLAVAPEEVDAVRFERLVTGVDEGGAQRARRLREALALWRGSALQGVDLPASAGFDAAVTRLERLRRTATEDRYDAEIGAGNGAGLVPELTDLLAEDPLRERVAAALMRALAAAGRDSEALLVYRRTASPVPRRVPRDHRGRDRGQRRRVDPRRVLAVAA